MTPLNVCVCSLRYTTAPLRLENTFSFPKTSNKNIEKKKLTLSEVRRFPFPTMGMVVTKPFVRFIHLAIFGVLLNQLGRCGLLKLRLIDCRGSLRCMSRGGRKESPVSRVSISRKH